MNTIKAIETKYNGYKFRSRTEARWAVFFDLMSIKYLYEHEGFRLSSGNYLPDFYLPKFEGGSYAEAKGGEFKDDEYKKCAELATLTRKPVLLLDGVPDFKCYNYYQWYEKILISCNKCFPQNDWSCDKDLCEAKYAPGVRMHYGIINNINKYGERIYVYPGFEGNDLFFKEDDWDEYYSNAVYCSRSARFEFGANGV